MKFGDFLFPESRTPETDNRVVNEALAEAELAERLGLHSVWLGEHHFDGVCTYADPMAFGGAVVARTSSIRVGFSAVQTAFHHPVRLAEQTRAAGQSERWAHNRGYGEGVGIQPVRIPRIRGEVRRGTGAAAGGRAATCEGLVGGAVSPQGQALERGDSGTAPEGCTESPIHR